MQTDATTPNIVGPTMLGQQCWELLRACWQWCANECNNSQQCWDLQCMVGRIQRISLCKPCVMSVRCPNNVGRAVQMDSTLLRYAHGTKEMLGVVGWKVWLVSNFAQQNATTSNNMQQGVQTDATCNIQQCWELLANNVASVCTGLKPASKRAKQAVRERESPSYSRRLSRVAVAWLHPKWRACSQATEHWPSFFEMGAWGHLWSFPSTKWNKVAWSTEKREGFFIFSFRFKDDGEND